MLRVCLCVKPPVSSGCQAEGMEKEKVECDYDDDGDDDDDRLEIVCMAPQVYTGVAPPSFSPPYLV